MTREIVHRLYADEGHAPLAASPAGRPDAEAVAADGGQPPQRGDQPRSALSAFCFSVMRSLPTLLVFGALAALGYWGHHHGWQMPSFSELTGTAAVLDSDWCDAHGVPESICIACNADLMPKGRLFGWCREHGVAECVWEHPELSQLPEPPHIAEADLARAHRALATKARPQNNPSCKLHLRRIQFVSRQAVDKAGIDIALVGRGRIVEAVAANGELTYDPTLVVRLSSPVPGTAWRVEKNVGDRVRAGELLALVDAAEVGRAKAALLQACAQLDLHSKTVERLASLEGIVPAGRLQEAETAKAGASAALQQAVLALNNLGLPVKPGDVRGQTVDALSTDLRFLGLPADWWPELERQHATANLIPVVARQEGVVTARDVVAGEVIAASKTLFTVVDNRRLWLLLDVPLEDARYLSVGQRVIFRPDGDVHDHEGCITWLSTEVDAETRTVNVRAELRNADGHLRNESFGGGQIIFRKEADAVIAPAAAIHWEGCCHVAFVRARDYFADDSFKVFHTRMVRLGATHGGYTELIAGLLPGEVIVTRGSGVLRAELLKGNLGAG